MVKQIQDRNVLKLIGIAVKYILFVLMILTWAFPVLWVILTSFKARTDIFTLPPKIFFNPTVEHYIEAFDNMPLEKQKQMGKQTGYLEMWKDYQIGKIISNQKLSSYRDSHDLNGAIQYLADDYLFSGSSGLAGRVRSN